MLVASITGSVTRWVGDAGIYAVFGLMVVDAVFPAASEIVMVYGGAVAAGAFAGQGVTLFGAQLSHGLPAYLAIALAGTLGYVLGSLVGWAIGDYGGRPLLERRGKLFHLDAGRLDRAERWFERWGDWAVLLGRITPVVRSFISIPAGVFRAPLGRYTVLTLIGSAAWCFALAGAGWAVGSKWERVHHDFRYADYVVVAAVIAGAAWLTWKLLARRRRKGAAGPGYTGSSE
jgi:membrane protein DedA with SNARE-associated domain